MSMAEQCTLHIVPPSLQQSASTYSLRPVTAIAGMEDNRGVSDDPEEPDI